MDERRGDLRIHRLQREVAVCRRTERLAKEGRQVCVVERGKSYPPGSFPRTPAGLSANFWDPSTQLRVVKKKGKVPAYPTPPPQDQEPQPAGWGD